MSRVVRPLRRVTEVAVVLQGPVEFLRLRVLGVLTGTLDSAPPSGVEVVAEHPETDHPVKNQKRPA